MEDFNKLFNPEVEIKEQTSKNADEYSPSADKGSNGIYHAIIRFVPNWQDPTHGSIQEKWVAWLVDPLTNKGKTIDCPSSVGKPSPLQDMYWKLKKSDNVAMQQKADIFSRRHSFASLVQVIKDKHNPDLEGKILVYRYGVKIWEKINAELKPLIGEKHDPFNLFTGKAFELKITKVSGYNNYDQSRFIEQRIPLCIPDNKGKLIPINKNNDKEEVFNWVKENSPDLSKYAFKEWDNDTYEFVNNIILTVTGETNVSQNYAGVINKDTKETSNEGISSKELNLDDLEEQMNTDLKLPDLPDNMGVSGDLDDLLKSL
jgi:hypothetical protein